MPRETVICWNANSLRKKLPELITLASSQHRPFCIMLLECKIMNPDNDPRVPSLPSLSDYGYTLFRKDYLPRQGGILVYIYATARGLRRRADLERSDHVLALECSVRNRRSLLLACYNHEASGSLGGILDSLRAAHGTGLPLFALGDFNAFHTDWCDGRANLAGNRLSALCSELELEVLNSVHSHNQPTFHRALQDGTLQTAVIDLAIASDPGSVHYAGPDADIQLHSDHYPLRLDLSRANAAAPDPAPKPAVWRLRTTNADWDLYRSAMEGNMALLIDGMHNLIAQRAPQAAVDAVWEEFRAVALQTAGVTIGFSRTAPTSGFSLPPDARAKLGAYHHAHRRHYRRPGPGTREELLRSRKDWVKAYKQVKSEAHARRCRRLDEGSPHVFWGQWARMQPVDKAPLSDVADASGNPPQSRVEALDNLAGYFASTCSTPEAKSLSDEARQAQTAWESGAAGKRACAADRPWTEQEVACGLHTVKVNSAPGPDGFHPLMLRHLGPKAVLVLTFLFNLSRRLGAVPTGWRQANVIPIYKREGDRADPANYRGISLTSVACKLYERLLVRRLWTLVGSKLSTSQAGFRPGYCTLDQLYRLRARAAAAFNSRRQLPVAFLDISKAFDRTWHPGIMLKLERLGVTGQAWLWIKAFLSGRQMRAVGDGEEGRWFNVAAGVPQGSVISPFLFLVFIDDVLETLSDCECALYADDIALWPRTPGPAANAALQRSLDSLSAWASRWRVAFNPKKSKVVVFRRVKELQLAPFSLGNVNLGFEEYYQYLGVRLESNLKWRGHYQALAQRVRGSVYAIAGTLKRSASPSAWSIRRLVQAIPVAQISYGMPIVRPDPATCAELNQLLALPLRRVLRLPKRTPALYVLAEFCLLDVERLFDKATLWFARRASTLPGDHPTALLWADSRCPVRCEVRRLEAVHGSGLSAAGALASLRDTQLGDWWGEEDEKHPLPIKLLKFTARPSSYLRVDSRTVASRRARLRFDRSGLNASRFKRKLVDSRACPDCKAPCDDSEHALLHCPVYSAPRQSALAALSQYGLSPDLYSIAMGSVDHLPSQHLQADALTATAPLIEAAARISSRRMI